MAERFNRLCVIGLGYVGLPTAAAFATNNIEVIGVDTDPDRVATINTGVAPIVEPHLDVMVRGAVVSGKLRAQQELAPADAFIIAVPTPLKDGHAPDLGHLQAAARSLASVLRSGNLVVLESTSPVGTTEALCEWLSALRPDLSFPNSKGEGSDIRVAYSPERILPGRIIVELLQNDRVVGGVTPACAAAAKALYEVFLQGRCSITNCTNGRVGKTDRKRIPRRQYRVRQRNIFGVRVPRYRSLGTHRTYQSPPTRRCSSARPRCRWPLYRRRSLVPGALRT